MHRLSSDLTCTDYQGFGIACQCPRPADACNLCEDGSDVPPPVSEETQVCGLISNFVTFFDENDCRRYQATIGLFCGCNNPIASEGYCRVCGGDTLLPDYERVAGIDEEGEEITCGDIELNDDGLECEAIQSEYEAICCSAATMEATAAESPGTDEPAVDDEPTMTPIVIATMENNVTSTEAPVAPEGTGAPISTATEAPVATPEDTSAPVTTTPVTEPPVASTESPVAPVPLAPSPTGPTNTSSARCHSLLGTSITMLLGGIVPVIFGCVWFVE